MFLCESQNFIVPMWTESLCRRKSSRVLNSVEKFWVSCFSSKKFLQTKPKKKSTFLLFESSHSLHSFALSSYSCIRMAKMEPSPSFLGGWSPLSSPSPSPSLPRYPLCSAESFVVRRSRCRLRMPPAANHKARLLAGGSAAVIPPFPPFERWQI